jgi:Xaa-Pro aminopeptidase
MDMEYQALLVTETLNQRYFHRLEFASGAVYLTPTRRVYLTWGGMGDTPEDLEKREIAQDQLGQAVQKLLQEDGLPGIAVEESIPLNIYRQLEAALGGEHIQPTSGRVAALREIKADWELKLLQKACDITDAAFAAVLEHIRPGVTELEVAAQLEQTMRLLGSEEFNKTIVAAGPNSAFPHHWPTDYVLQPGDFVTMDYGCTVGGYHSDLTRTVVVGKATEKQKKIYDTVLAAQLAAEDALQAGKTGGELDRVARNIIDATEFSGSFLHNLGHGIGLDIHEGTGLVRDSQGLLKPGMVVSVEPGIYLSGYGGVRIEDLAVVREGGCEILEHSTKELIQL